MLVRLAAIRRVVTSSGSIFEPGEPFSVDPAEGEKLIRQGAAVLLMAYKPEMLKSSRVVETPSSAAFLKKPKKVQRWQ